MHYQRWRLRGTVADPEATADGVARRVNGQPCTVEDCSQVGRRRGLCATHYRRWRTTGETGEAVAPRNREPCSVEGCEKRVRARGWCNAHYEQWRTTGSPLTQRERVAVQS